MLTTTEAAARLGISTRRVRVLAEQGRIRGEKVGRDWVLDEESVAGFHRQPPGRPRTAPE